MPEIMLVSCPPWGVVMPPLGIAYLATYLKSQGKEVEVYDLNLALYKSADSKQKQFWDLNTINRIAPLKIAENIFKNFDKGIIEFINRLASINVVGFSANNLISTAFAGIIAGKIKKKWPKKVIILGGPGCFHSWDRKTVPQGSADFFVIGEGEEVLNQFLEKINQNSGISGIDFQLPGLLECNASKKTRFFPPANIKNLDLIAHPTFEEFNLSEYNFGQKYRPLPMLMSRGCINRCSYCIDWYMSSGFRVRKPENIINEIKHHVQRYGITHVEFNDLLCNGNLLQLEKFCDLLIESKLDIRWISYAAIRKNMSDDLLAKIKKSGCNSLCYGAESGSNRVLKRMNKHYSREDASKLIKRTHETGIEVRINIIVGFPGETESDFQQTLNFLKENKDFINQVTNVSSFVLMPGSDLAVYPHRYGIRYKDETDPGSWTDELGLSQSVRNQRVEITCRLLKELNISNLIVNYQERKAKQIHFPENEISSSGEGNTEQSIQQEITHNTKKKKSMFKMIWLFFIFVFSLVTDFYLMLLKKIRGSIIFPGS